MKMACRIVLIVVVWVASFSDGDKLFPNPSLTQRRSRVMRLECKPPPEAASDWTDVHDVRVFVCPPRFDTCTNHTVATMTSAMTSPRRGSVLPSIAKVTFSGSWTPAGSPSLTVETPFSSEYYGVYFCTAEYSSSDGSIQNYTAAIHANVSGQANFWRDHFHIKIMEAHALYVTWQSPIGSAFQEGVVTRISTDREGTVTAAPRSLFMATAKKNFTYDDEGVLLARFEPPYPPEENYTMAVYVDSKMCSPFCQYSCSVPYEACIGPDVLFCECNHENNVASPAAASAGLSKGGIGAICLALLIVVLIIVIVILLRRGKLPRLKTLLNAPTVNKEMNTCTEAKESDTQTETVELATNQRIQEPPKNLGYKMTVDLPPRKLSENESKGRQGQIYSSDEQITQDLHQKDEGSNRREEDRHRRQINERTKHPLDDVPLPEEPEEGGASGGERRPLLAPEPAYDNSPAGTEQKRAQHSSEQRAAYPSQNSGRGGARHKDTHQHPAASFSSRPVTNTSTGDGRPISPSTSRHSDYSNPIQDHVNTSEQNQTKTDLGHGTGEEQTTGHDFSVSPSSESALNLRPPSNDTEKQPKSVTEGSHSNSKEVP